MDHAYWPIGPVGHPTEFHIAQTLLTMAYTKYPQACRALMAFIMEVDQYNKWLFASEAYISHTLNAYAANAYAANPLWTEDPKRAAFRDAAKRSLPVGLGSVGEKATSAFADFVLVDMFCEFLYRARGRQGGNEDCGAPVAADLSFVRRRSFL